MTEVLEGVLTLVGIALVLALAAERLQELVKAAFAVKSSVRLAGIRRLIREAATATGFGEDQAEVIIERVLSRVRALNQRGLRPSAVRLDHLSKCDLKRLVAEVDPQTVEALGGVAPDVAQGRLHQVAGYVEAWYDLALAPVDQRYGRRMRLGALLSAAAVVLALNADGLALARSAWSDPALRDSVTARLGSLTRSDSAMRARFAARDSLRADSTATDSARAASDSALAGAVAARDAEIRGTLAQIGLRPFDYPEGFTVTLPWVTGILLSILLVSLGAPFWHDVLEAILGLKKKARELRP